jgi:hypothetical protein
MAVTHPHTLFKYRAFNQFTLMSLINRGVWFSKPTSFNDPFDCQIQFSDLKPTKAEYLEDVDYAREKLQHDIRKKVLLEVPDSAFSGNELSAEYTQKIFDFRNQIEDHISKSRVLSLSETNSNTTMWSHYADSHQGICIAYDMNQLLGSVDKTRSVHKVGYFDANDINFNQYSKYAQCCCGNDSDSFHSIVLEMLTTKSNDWKYEAEWRVIGKQFGNVNAGLESIHAIYFGLKANTDTKMTIRNIFAAVPMRYYQMIRSKEGLTLEPVPMQKNSQFWVESPS